MIIAFQKWEQILQYIHISSERRSSKIFLKVNKTWLLKF